MPLKLSSTLHQDNAEARIEIIPLIDIMFFLLASFMLVSLSMVNLKSVPVNLPTAVSAATDVKKDYADISVDKTGGLFLNKKPVATNELTATLQSARQANPALRVFISADKDAHHGDVIRALDAARLAGIDKVAFEIGNTPVAAGAPTP
jgi:biopolymer transport protein ExbD